MLAIGCTSAVPAKQYLGVGAEGLDGEISRRDNGVSALIGCPSFGLSARAKIGSCHLSTLGICRHQSYSFQLEGGCLSTPGAPTFLGETR